MSGIKIETGSNSQIRPYKLGSQVELMFQTDDAAASLLGASMDLGIYDIFDNQIDLLQAVRVSPVDNLYVATYTIPFSLSDSYNSLNDDTTNLDNSLFYLKDKWIFTNGDFVEFPFHVHKKYDQPVSDNMEYFLRIDPRLKALDGSVYDNDDIHFTSTLTPYYSSVQAVRDTFPLIFDGYDNFAIAREIIAQSRYVDYHMRPNSEYVRNDNTERLMNAISGFVTNYTAKGLLVTLLSTTSEEKMLDTFKISRSTSGKDVLDLLDEYIKKYSNIIWAGGKDTPFISKMFQKGLYDPNRPSSARASLDTSGWYPWVNQTTKAFLVNIDGNNVEVRGERTISFRTAGSSYSGFGGGLDAGDVGYLAGI